MKVFLNFIFIISLLSVFEKTYAANWCKVVYKKEISPGDLQKQINKCKTYDNLFLAIHTSFINSGHLLNSFVSELCDLNRRVITSEPRPGDPYFSAVCEFRKHNLRK